MAFEMSGFKPRDELRNIQRQMDRFGLGRPRVAREDIELTNLDEALSVDVYQKDGNLVVKAALPGVDKKDIDVNVAESKTTSLHINVE